ncbi:MAG: tetratricopeptide repeat protein [Terriglobia bacterium]
MQRIQMMALAALLVISVATIRAAEGAAGQNSSAGEVEKHFNAGQRAMSAGRPDEAVQEFKAVLRLDPELGEARINLGLAYHLLGDYRLAATELESGLRQNPSVLGANIVLGIDELKLGSPAQAIPPLERALRLDPSNQEAQRTLADAFLASGNYLEAGRSYRTAFREEPETADKWFHLGKTYLQMSSQLAARMTQEYPNTTWAARLAGDLLSERLLWSDAARKYQLALARDPSQPGLHSSLGNAFLEQGKLHEAQQEYASAIKLDPVDAQALLGLAGIAMKNGQANRALSYISKIAETSPRVLADTPNFPRVKLSPALAATLASQLANVHPQPGAHFLLASLYEIAGQTAKAQDQQRAFQAVLGQSRTTHAETQASRSLACNLHQYEACATWLESKRDLSGAQYLKVGTARFALQQYAQASDAFASAFARKTAGPRAAYWLTRTYLKLADQCFSHLQAAFPNAAQTHKLLAESYGVRGEDDKAIGEYQIAIAARPDDASLDEALGELYLKERKPPEARRALQKALQLDPKRARSLYLMGRLVLGQQKPEEAIGYLGAALRLEPHLLAARASLGMAYLRAGKPALAVPQLEAAASLDDYGDLHYMLYQAYLKLGKTTRARNALAASQALRRKTEARDQARIRSAEKK